MSAAAPPTWDQAEAARLLAELRAAVDAQRRAFGGSFPAPLSAVVADYLAVAEGYVANHEAEAARGWDAMQLLAGVRPRLTEIIRRARQDRRQVG